MKRILLTSLLAVLVAFATTVKAQDYPDEYLGLPGDNLNLYAVMKLFQDSETLEGFERSLNDEKNRINNLDLNGDNYVDYLMVFDYTDGDVHTIVLRAALDRNELQDVAVFTVQRFSNGSVQIQLIGDEALYGKNYIIEPNYAERPNPGYIGRPKSNTGVTVVYTSYYEVAHWPVIRYIFLPDYVVWRSSWYWGYYPPYWRTWRPHYWHYYYGYHYNWYHHYYRHYRYWHQPRYTHYHTYYYTTVRVNSPVVYNKINEGSYKTSYSRPETRRDGEALFASSHPDRERRTVQNTPVMSQRRTSSSQPERVQATTRTSASTSRRPENTGSVRSSEKPAARPSSDRTINESRRPATYVNERPAAKAQEVRRDPAPVKRDEAPRITQPAKSQTERKAPAATKPKSSERRTEKPQKAEESEKPRR